MNKTINDGIKTLDQLNKDLEDVKKSLLTSNYEISQVDNSDMTDIIEDLRNENSQLKKELLEYEDFLNLILKKIDNVIHEIKELNNNE